MLQKHPDQALIYDVCDSLRTGVDIGFRGLRKSLTTHNMQSALNNPAVIHDTVTKELASSWSAGPFATIPFSPYFVVNSIGVVPKKSGSFRMITDLSRPADGVNHNINKEEFGIQYSGVDQAVGILKSMGPEIFDILMGRGFDRIVQYCCKGQHFFSLSESVFFLHVVILISNRFQWVKSQIKENNLSDEPQYSYYFVR